MPPENLPSCILAFKSGKSDKVYQVWITKDNKGKENDLNYSRYTVRFAYGRRGSSLKEGVKDEFLMYANALYAYDIVVGEKLAKGYEHIVGDVPALAKKKTPKKVIKKKNPIFLVPLTTQHVVSVHDMEIHQVESGRRFKDIED